MNKFTKQNGITLIALIITIIVMLILVAVTISVALNGGIFNNATDAKTKTQKAVSKEELIAAMVGAYDNTGSFDKDLVGTLPSGAKWCKENETFTNATNDPDECEWIVTETGNKFYVDESGSVLDEKPQASSYSFKLNSLGTPIEFGDGYAFFSSSKFWSKVGKDLSQDAKYTTQDGILFITSDNSLFFDGALIEYGVVEEAPSGTEYYVIVMVMEDEDKVGVGIYDENFDDVVNSSNYSTFLTTEDANNNKFGEVEFTFRNISEIEFPEGD